MKRLSLLMTMATIGLVIAAGCCPLGTCKKGNAGKATSTICSGCGEVKGSAKCCK